MLRRSSKNKGWAVLGIVLGVFLVSQVIAQASGWSCRIRIPPDPLGFAKEDLEKLMWIEIKNKEKESTPVYLHGEIKKDGKLVARANSPKIDIPRGGKRITRGDITKLTDEWWDRELEKMLIRAPVLPEGRYEACIYVYKWGTKELLTKCCITFTSKSISPPRLISPKDGAKVGKYPLFKWIPPTPTPPKITYYLKIVEIRRGQTKEEAMKANRPWFEKKGITTPSFLYPTSAKVLKEGKEYAWQVSAIGGMSEVWQFGVKLPAPKLVVIGTEDYEAGGKEWTRYRMTVTNRSAFPGDLFAPAPDLPPCGSNTSASRTWVDIYAKDGTRLYGFCALSSSEDLDNIWFAVPRGQAPPDFVYITLTDRRCENTYTSNLAPVPPLGVGTEIYFADAGETRGSVYRYNIATHSETKIYTRPSRRLYSFLFAPWDLNKLYFINANEHKIYQKDLSAGAPPESIVYTHTTYVRDIAIPEDGLIYFSEATGAGGNGKIYRLEKDGSITLFYRVRLATVDGFWGGDFAFDEKGTLYLSTGNRVGASIYRVDVAADVVTKVYTAPGECIEGMIFGKDSLLYYADWRTKIYALDLTTGHRSIVYNNPSRKWLSDVGFKPIELSVDPPPGITTWIMPYGVGGTSLDRIDALGLTSYSSVDSAPFGGYLGFRHGSASSIPTTDIAYYRWLYKHDSIPGWNEFTIPVVVHYVKECIGFLPVFPTYRLGPDNIGGNNLYQFKPHEPPPVPGCTTYWPTSGFLGDIYSGFLSSAGAHLPPGRYKIKLEIYDSTGNQKMPPGAFQFIVPTSEDPDGTIHTRKALLSEIEGGGFTFALHIDNRPCSAYIAAPEIGGVGASDTCGFLRFDPADTTPVHIAFHASHPDGFARFRFKIVRGIEIAESTFVAYPNVFATSAGVYTGDGSGNFEHDFSRATLLGPCTEAAFSENLYVYAKATRGWGHRISALDASFVRAFALAEQKEE